MPTRRVIVDDLRRWILAGGPVVWHGTGRGDWVADMAAQNVVGREDMTTSTADAPVAVALRLAVPVGARVAHRSGLRWAEGRPMHVVSEWTARPGIAPVRARHEIVARAPTAEEAASLQLRPGEPVLQVTRVDLADDGTPVQLVMTVGPGDRNLLVYDLPA